LIRDGAGNLYGTTQNGGGSGACYRGCGTVFKLSPTGGETVLHSFSGEDGSDLYAGLIGDAAGNLYGTTAIGGVVSTACPSRNCGVVFKLGPTGTETVLHTFAGYPTDGANPFAALLRDAAGNLYGTTNAGGAFSPCFQTLFNNGCGTVFEVSATGTETVLYSFSGGADGADPFAELIRDAAGNLYGTTVGGGPSSVCGGGCGTVFKLSPSGTETVLHTFSGGADGGAPVAGLIRDAAGNLYGTTTSGGSVNRLCLGDGDTCGVVFRLSPTGTETVLHSFTRGDGANPNAGLIADSAGNLYGTTEFGGAYGRGVVFELSRCDSAPSGYDFKVLYSFTGGADGAFPIARLVRDATGNLYGTTYLGGTYDYGVVFRLAH
jgi:uncharacterized repeat protein (TIGR03803 family)